MKAALLICITLAIFVVSAVGFNAVRNDGPPDLVVLTLGLMILAGLVAFLLRLDSVLRNR